MILRPWPLQRQHRGTHRCRRRRRGRRCCCRRRGRRSGHSARVEALRRIHSAREGHGGGEAWPSLRCTLLHVTPVLRGTRAPAGAAVLAGKRRSTTPRPAQARNGEAPGEANSKQDPIIVIPRNGVACQGRGWRAGDGGGGAAGLWREGGVQAQLIGGLSREGLTARRAAFAYIADARASIVSAIASGMRRVCAAAQFRWCRQAVSNIRHRRISGA